MDKPNRGFTFASSVVPELSGRLFQILVCKFASQRLSNVRALGVLAIICAYGSNSYGIVLKLLGCARASKETESKG
jgi:hypothetical protein